MDDIRPPNETFDNIGRVRRLQIERERPLSSLRAEKGPLHAAHHVTPGSLDLDDVGTQIAQNHRCQRTCDERTEVDNMNALERRSEEHTSELQSLMRISYAVFCLKKKITHNLSLCVHRTTRTVTSFTFAH